MDDVHFSSAQKSELLRGVHGQALDAVRQAGIVRRVKRNGKLLKQGDAPDHLFVVTAGGFKMTTLNEQGQQKTLRFMEPGDAIGCVAVFRNIPYPASAIATTNSSVVGWNASQFNQLLRVHPQLAQNALSIVGDRAEEMFSRVHLTGGTVEQRLARAILGLMKQGTAIGESIAISGQDLAELSDTTPFSVSRTMSAWKRAGIVLGGRGRVVVLSPHRLSEISETELGK